MVAMAVVCFGLGMRERSALQTDHPHPLPPMGLLPSLLLKSPRLEESLGTKKREAELGVSRLGLGLRIAHDLL